MQQIPVCFFVGLLLFRLGLCELYTALVDLKEVLQTEKVLLDTFDKYIQSEQQKLNLLYRYVETYKSQHEQASEDDETFIANPINAYLLIKQLTVDLKQVESLMGMNIGQDFLKNISSYKDYMKFPTDEDLNGAAVALTRLQDTYKLDTASLARGELNGVKYSSELTAADCFELGRQSYINDDFYHTRLWMQEADARLREVNETIEKSLILEYLAYSIYKQGNIPLALDLTNKILKIYPTHSGALKNKVYYEDEIQKTTFGKTEGDDDSSDIVHDQPVSSSKSHVPQNALYEQLCRGEVTTPIEISTKLKCLYVNNNNPFLFIAPFKVEEAYLQPRILIFYDVMSDNEIDIIKRLAQPRFQRARVHNRKTGESQIATYRISKSAWIKEHEHKLVDDVCRRITDMTGLTMQTAEELQVVNYGIGGHYEPHFDFSTKEEMDALNDPDNRIATALFYMSDVAQGGATVFPNIKVALWPKKGTAAFWYNLHSSGEGDPKTLHAACPVLAGSKWASNKWIHQQGQEFLRPCNLTPTPPELTA